MPLDRDHMTVASQWMVPAYVLFFVVNGLNYMTASANWLLPSPMLRYANSIMDIRLWGAMFLACGLLMFAAMWMHHRNLYRFGLLMCATSLVIWAAISIAGIFFEHVSYSAWTWPGLIAVACLATNRSLVRDRFHLAGG